MRHSRLSPTELSLILSAYEEPGAYLCLGCVVQAVCPWFDCDGDMFVIDGADDGALRALEAAGLA